VSRAAGLPVEELRAERDMLAYARECLAAMRRRAESLRVLAGDPYAEEAAAWRLRQRVASLADDPDTALFFGRLDYDLDAVGTPPAAGMPEAHEARFYVGRRHVVDGEGDPVVVDWRAGISRPFYRATPRRRHGVRVRRRFGYQGGTLTSIQDELLTQLDEAESQAVADRVLVAEIERPRIGPMRDIVATIQPEQDDLIRAPLAQTVCIQGGPGTGKTAVGLHRVAFLLYEHRERLGRDGVLVVGPSRAYLAFIRDVLPGLGEVRVAQESVESLVGAVAVRGEDPPETAAVKADARLAEVVRRAAFLHLRPPTGPLSLRFRHRVVTLSEGWLRSRVDHLLELGGRYAVGRAHLRDWIVEHCLRELERSDGLTDFDSPGEVVRALARDPALRGFMDRTWPALDPARLVFRLLSDDSFLAAAADGVLSAQEQRRLRWPRRPRGLKAAPWSVADAFLVDEAADVIAGVPGFGHVVADEAQDLSPMQLRAIGRRCRYGSATLLGDLAQGTSAWAAERWEDVQLHLGRPAPRMERLPRAFRAPREVLDWANRLLPEIAPGTEPAASVRAVPGALLVRPASADGLTAAWLEELAAARAEEGSVGLVVADAALAGAVAELERREIGFEQVDRFDVAAGVTVVPASAAKGLEFDHVVLVEPAEVAMGGHRGLHLLYVALTRAVLRLRVVHAKPLPAALTPPPG
jgi:DNA helicase IV